MKWLVYIFSCYLLAITCLPCADNDCKEGTVAVATSHQDEHHQGDEEKSCSPFCYCSCCQTVCVTKLVMVSETIPTLKNEKISSLIVSYPQENADAIWQPPKVS